MESATFVQRRLMESITENPTFKWAMIAVGATVGALLLVALIILCVVVSRKRQNNKVAPETPGAAKQDVEKGIKPPAPTPFNPPPGAGVDNGWGSPIPPWEQYGLPPPGIMLAPTVPLNFQPYVSNPRPPNAPPYERLVLISSRVHQPMKVAQAALPNVAVVVYDWKTFTLQELVRYIKKALGPGGKVTSVAVVAPGNKPGTVALLEGNTSTAEKLANGGGELGQFWRVLAGCVTASEIADGRRVDLLGCRVVEAPRDGAALLKAFWVLTSVPFAAADDALGGYMLSTFIEDPSTGTLSIIASTVKAIDIYFDRYALLGIEPPGVSAPDAGLLPPAPDTKFAPPLPAGQPPAGALQPSLAAAAAAPAAAGYLPAGAVATPPVAATPAVPKDIFSRFTEACKSRGLTPAEAYSRYDTDKSGYLAVDELARMTGDLVPGASQLDLDHFKAVMDLDGNQRITLAEYLAALDENKRVAAAVRTGRDDTALMRTLHDYLTDNDAVLRQYFNEADVNKSGTLDHVEVAALVAQIPGLAPDEQRFIVSYLYQQDKTGTGLLTLDQLKAAVKSFGTPAAQAAVLAPAPAAAPAQPPAAAAPVPVWAVPGTSPAAAQQQQQPPQAALPGQAPAVMSAQAAPPPAAPAAALTAPVSTPAVPAAPAAAKPPTSAFAPAAHGLPAATQPSVQAPQVQGASTTAQPGVQPVVAQPGLAPQAALQPQPPAGSAQQPALIPQPLPANPAQQAPAKAQAAMPAAAPAAPAAQAPSFSPAPAAMQPVNPAPAVSAFAAPAAQPVSAAPVVGQPAAAGPTAPVAAPPLAKIATAPTGPAPTAFANAAPAPATPMAAPVTPMAAVAAPPRPGQLAPLVPGR